MIFYLKICFQAKIKKFAVRNIKLINFRQIKKAFAIP
jgi:hypothetical protein